MGPKNRQVRILGAIIFPLIYGISLLLWRDIDALVATLGIFGAPLWFIQWIGFLLGRWIGAVMLTILALGLIGYILGWFIDRIITQKATDK